MECRARETAEGSARSAPHAQASYADGGPAQAGLGNSPAISAVCRLTGVWPLNWRYSVKIDRPSASAARCRVMRRAAIQSRNSSLVMRASVTWPSKQYAMQYYASWHE